MSCPFCDVAEDRVIYDADLTVRCIWDAFPVSPGHVLVITRRHIGTWFEATPGEQAGMLEGIAFAKTAIEAHHQPDGYNIGINVGDAAGQTVDHLHLHVIPRYRGDVADPTGGVRHVIPDKANYLNLREERSSYTVPDVSAETSVRIHGTEQHPLKHELVRDMADADRLDLAVAFVLESGLTHLLPHIEDLLDRDGRVRVLAGDYMGVTEPRALIRLLDLAGQHRESVELRVFETTKSIGFHPKAYLLRGKGGQGVAYVGSSNLTYSALLRGLEWNYRLSSLHDRSALVTVQREFEHLLHHPRTRALTMDWVERYRDRRHALERVEPTGVDLEQDKPEAPPTPHGVQQEALAALKATREAGNRAGLVVLATGLGKTWLAAFDSKASERVLFVAHREEILQQARATFRRIRPDARLGDYTGDEKQADAEVVFASIQTLGKARHLNTISSDTFNYVIVDEFHHAAAPTYRRLIHHFRPEFLLGLTATPDRSDGADLLSLCAENLVYRCDLVAGIDQKLLSPFHYFGIPDDVDYTNIPWRSGRFDPTALETAVSTKRRAQNAYQQWKKKGGDRTLAFCVSQIHANYMTEFFRDRGVRCVAVHSAPGSAPRADSLEKLQSGELQVVFAVDMFNEGVDVPSIDTVLMLRPTESKILWLQQFGRGLIIATGKAFLTVIDYIGNHRTFLQGPMVLLPGAADSYHDLRMALEHYAAGDLQLPAGCEITYDLEAQNILRALLPQTTQTLQALQSWYKGFKAQHDIRPRAAEAWHAGYDPKSVRRANGSWFQFVKAQGDLTELEQRTLEKASAFLSELETTRMTKSYKMLTLLGMISHEKFPGEISIAELTDAFSHLAIRSALLVNDIGDAFGDRKALVKLIEENPIDAWIKGRGTGGHRFFDYSEGFFRSQLSVDPDLAISLRELTEELCEWRLAQYLGRLQGERGLSSRIICNVRHANGRPILFLPPREKNPGIPQGPTPIEANGVPLEAVFVKITVNVIHEPGQKENALPTLLRAWFGEDAGQRGRGERVMFELIDGLYHLKPLGGEQIGPQLWHEYERAVIPTLWGLEFSRARWNQGFVQQGEHIFLLVSLKKGGLAESFQYDDKFLSPTLFQWHSQNRHRRDSNAGNAMSRHRERGISVHLFVRQERKTARGTAAPFAYCGDVDFVDWEGEQPITVRWQLVRALPGHLKERFAIP